MTGDNDAANKGKDRRPTVSFADDVIKKEREPSKSTKLDIKPTLRTGNAGNVTNDGAIMNISESNQPSLVAKPDMGSGSDTSFGCETVGQGLGSRRQKLI